METLLLAASVDVNRVGHKAANLSKLIELGLRVPEGLVLPVDECEQPNLMDRLQSIVDTLEEILPSTEGWAVRSSASNEDTAEESKAGQFQTVIISEPTALPAAVIAVLDSKEARGTMAVIIQSYVKADFSGVVFSKHPLTDEEEIVIELYPGSGEQVVQGQVTPWRFAGGEWDTPLPKELLTAETTALQKCVAMVKATWNKDVDMEFCIKDQTIYWLQARPITTTANLSSTEWFLFDQCTEPITPLIQVLDPSGLFHAEHWETQFIQEYAYISLKRHQAIDLSEVPVNLLTEWEQLKNRYEPLFDQYLQCNLSSYSLPQLWSELLARKKVYRDYCQEYMKREWLYVRGAALDDLAATIKQVCGEDVNVDAILASLSTGIGTITAQKYALLEQLVVEARKLPDVLEWSMDNLATYAHPWVEAFWHFIEQYGYESPHAITCNLPTLDEQPDVLLDLIKHLVQLPLVDDRPVNTWEEWASLIAARLTSTERVLFYQQLHLFRDSLLRTENDDYLLQKGVASVRRVIVKLGEKLYTASDLTNPAHIFFLLPQEIEQLIDGEAQVLSSQIAQRVQRFQRAKERSPVFVIGANGDSANSSVSEQLLRGSVASPGQAEGYVFLLTNPLDRSIYQSIPGQAIVVSPVLSPSFTYHLLSVAAIVTEVGGFLSHGAIFAREKGIPAIVAVDNVMDQLQTGDYVRVDANHGLIEIISRQSKRPNQ